MTAFARDRIETPLGPMLLVADARTLLLLEFLDAGDRADRMLARRFGPEATFEDHLDPHGFSTAVTAYFAGRLDAIDALSADGGGTGFQRRVWSALREIPCGRTESYGALAMRLGDVKATRAVGLANGANPIAIVVPCHRVIGADGSLTGYGGGVERKRWLLRHEGALPGARSGQLSLGL
jgi:methylated-DNA-[protein]-cysteine S-methyltransferase